MSYLFNSSLLIGLLRTYAKGTTSVAAIYYKDLQSIPIPLPPKNEQAEIVRYLDSEIDKIDRLYFETKKITDVIKERRSALISAAVTGKIDVRGWTPPASSAPDPQETRMEAV